MSSEEKVVALPAERSGWLIEVEALRAFSFVFIVFGHAVGMMASLSHGWLSMAAFGAVLGLTRFALLAFMTMSSLLIAKRIADGKSGSILRSAWRLVVPYTLFTVAYLLLERALAGGPPILAPQLAGQATRAWLTGTGFYHLWYVVIAIQIVLVAPLIGEALARVDLQKQLTWLLIAVTGTMVLLGQLNGPIVHALPWTGVLFGGIADRIVVFWTAYVVLGAVMGLNWESTIALIRRYRLVLLAVYALVAVALVALIARQSSVVAGDYQAVADMSRVLQPWIVPFEILSILAWLYLSGLVARTRVGKPIAALSSASFGGYLIHPFWLLLATQWVYANNPMPNAAATVLLVTAFALAASYLSVVAISRVTTPLGTALIGASPAVAIEAKVDPLESKAG